MSEEANQGAPEEKGEGSRRRRSRSSGSEEKAERSEKQESTGRRRRRRRSRGGREKSQSGEAAVEGKSQERSGSSRKERRSSGKGSSGSRSRGGRKRSNRGRSNRNKGSNRGNQQQQQQQRSRRKTPVRKLKTPESKLGGREPLLDPSEIGSSGPPELSAFELFCACYLGITENNNFRKQSLGEVAQRFRISTEEVKRALKSYGMDRESMRRSSFDMSLAELDMKVAPGGLDKKELARPLFEDFLLATPEAKEAIEAAEESSE
jgi:hypothetical protein